jgi:glutamate carboxypeptidase
MSIVVKTAIFEHLGWQHQAMVALLADLVNIDSGSYNKRGVDEVGNRLRSWLETAGISCEIFPNEVLAIASRRASLPAAAVTGRSC